MARGQTGLEYAGLLLLILVALSPVLYFSVVQMQSTAALSTGRRAVASLASAVDSLAASGEGSASVVTIGFPDFIENSAATHASGKEVALGLLLPTGRTEAYAVTSANVSGSMPLTSGPHTFNLTMNSSGVVLVSEVS